MNRAKATAGNASERRRVGRPDRGAQRDEEPLDEGSPVAAVGQQLAERRARRGAAARGRPGGAAAG